MLEEGSLDVAPDGFRPLNPGLGRWGRGGCGSVYGCGISLGWEVGVRTAVGSCGIYGLGCGVGLAKALADLHWGECGSYRERGQVSKWLPVLESKDQTTHFGTWFGMQPPPACPAQAGQMAMLGPCCSRTFGSMACRVAVRLLRSGEKGRKWLLRVRMVKRGKSAMAFLMDSENQDCGLRLRARRR